MLTSASIPSAVDRRVAWSAIAISAGVTSGVIWQFHASRHMPVAEPWFTFLALLPHFAAVVIYSWTKSVGNVAWMIGPWLLHDAVYIAMTLIAPYSWMDAVTWRASHGLMMIFIGAPTLIVQVWSQVRRRR